MKKQRVTMGAARLCVLAGLAVAADPARLRAETGLDLTAYTLEPVYAADFTDAAANRIVSESAELFAGDERQPLPTDAVWVYEGADRAWIEDGKLWLGGAAKTSRFQPEAHEAQYHSVLWNTHEFPADFLLEFTFTQTQKTGLNIVFLAARAREAFGGGDPFQPGLPRRRGRFDEYTQGALDCYHISYYATTPRGDPRGQSNLRKNHGFHLVAEGEDFISDLAGLGPHQVRVLKVGARLTLEVNGRIALAWTDPETPGGPPHGAGWIGLRQMRHSALCAYDSFQVWAVKGPPTAEAPRAETPYRERVRAYADAMLAHGRDRWGAVHSPLFATMLDRETHDLVGFSDYVRWTHPNSGVGIVSYRKGGKRLHGFGAPASDRMPDSANLGHDQYLYLTLYRLSEATGDPQYARAAEDALRYFWLHCQDANTGMMAWGEHMAWHLVEDTWWSSTEEGHSRIHEPDPWPAELWERCYAMDDDVRDALKRYALGIWKWQVADHEEALTNRHVYPDGFPNVARTGREYPRLVGQFCRYWADAYAHSEDEALRAEMLRGIESFVANSIRRAKPNGALPFGTHPRLENYYHLGHQFIMLSRLHHAAGIVPADIAAKIRELTALTEAVILEQLDHRLDPAAEHPGYLRFAEADTLAPGDTRKKQAGDADWNDPAVAFSGTWGTAPLALDMLDYFQQTGQAGFRDLGLQGADLVLALTGSEPAYPESMRPGDLAALIQVMVRAYAITGEERYFRQGQRFGQDALTLFLDELSPLPAVLSLPNKHNQRLYEARTGGPTLMYALLELAAAPALTQ